MFLPARRLPSIAFIHAAAGLRLCDRLSPARACRFLRPRSCLSTATLLPSLTSHTNHAQRPLLCQPRRLYTPSSSLPPWLSRRRTQQHPQHDHAHACWALSVRSAPERRHDLPRSSTSLPEHTTSGNTHTLVVEMQRCPHRYSATTTTTTWSVPQRLLSSNRILSELLLHSSCASTGASIYNR